MLDDASCANVSDAQKTNFAKSSGISEARHIEIGRFEPKADFGQSMTRSDAASPKQPFNTLCSNFVGQRAAQRDFAAFQPIYLLRVTGNGMRLQN